MMNLDEQGCIRLVNGIVKKAVQDWRIAKKRLFQCPDTMYSSTCWPIVSASFYPRSSAP
ncbi:MAG: hypothetical protein J6M47_02645 [Clostridia bacterium]|nr:hypothetical protein [Clostridia bacterium]